MGKKSRIKKRDREQNKISTIGRTQAIADSNEHWIRKHEVIFILLMVLLVGMIYSNTLESPFLFDDKSNIMKNYDVRMIEISLDTIKKAIWSNRPVSMLSFAFNYYFHKLNPFGYHLVNIFIHIIVGILLYVFLKNTFQILNKNKKEYFLSRPENSSAILFLTVFIWLVHPLQTQSVTYIVQRMNSLASLFYLLAFWSYIKARLSGNKIFFIITVISGFLALGSKEIAVTLPFFIFLYEWYFFRDLDFNWLKNQYKWMISISVLFLVSIFIFVGPNPMDKILDGYDVYPFTMFQRVLTQFRVLILYISLIIYPNPSRMILDYNFSVSQSLFSPFTTFISMIIILAILSFAILRARKNPLVSFSILWFFGNLFIESSIVALDLVFEHRIYLPSMFIILIFVISVFKYIKLEKLSYGLLIIIISIFSVWTYQRNGVWENAFTFWQDNVKKSQNNPRPKLNLAIAMTEEGRTDEAVQLYHEIINIAPTNSKAYNNLGNVLVNMGKIDEAILYFQKGIRVKPRDAELNYNLGNAFLGKNDLRNAIKSFQKSIELNNNYPKAYNNLGFTLAATGRIDEAISKYYKALKIDRENTEALNNLGLAFAAQGKLDKAIIEYNKVLRIEPDNVKTILNLGSAFSNMGKIDKAMTYFDKALKLNPAHPDTYYNIGNVHRKKKDLKKAEELYGKAISLDPFFFDARYNLGTILMKQNKLSPAIIEFKKIIEEYKILQTSKTFVCKLIPLLPN